MEEIAMVDGLNHEFIGLRRGSAIQNFLTEIAAKTGKELKMRARLDSFDAICRMAERNIGIGVVPSSAAERCSRTMDIHIVRLTDPWATRELNVAVRKACELSPQAKLLLNYLKQASLCGRKPDLDLPAPAAAVAVASL
jgi:DNA-binding transcriptional LysR family regulator